jgi:hypothetical protein
MSAFWFGLPSGGTSFVAIDIGEASWASIMLSRNAPLLYVQQQGGWSNASVLLRVYAKWMPSQADLVQDPATQAQPNSAIINRIRRDQGG